GMPQPRRRLHLAAEALARLDEVQVLGQDELERDVALQRLLARAEHHAHAARAQPLEQPEVPEPLGDLAQRCRTFAHAHQATPGGPRRVKRRPLALTLPRWAPENPPSACAARRCRRRALSSVGESSGLIIRWSQVRVLEGPPATTAYGGARGRRGPPHP